MKLLRIAFVLALLAAVTGEVGSSFLLEQKIAAAVRARDPGAKDVSADVSFPLLYGLATKGSVRKVVVSGRNVNLVSLTADKVTAVATGVHVDVRSSIQQRTAVVTKVDRVNLTVSFTQEQASAILPPGYTFVFGDGTVTLHGPVTSLTGRFELRPPAQVVFTLGGVPPAGLPSLPSIKFPVAPLSGCLQSIKLAPGTVSFTCVQDHPTTDFLPHR